MTELEEMLARITAVIDECDATRLPPVIKLTPEQLASLPTVPPSTNPARVMLDVPVQVVENVEDSTPHQLRHQPCCDRHTDRCEVPFEVCCDTCPEAVALAALVEEHQQSRAVDPVSAPAPRVGFLAPPLPTPRPWWQRYFEKLGIGR